MAQPQPNPGTPSTARASGGEPRATAWLRWGFALLLLTAGFTCDGEGPNAGGPHPEPPVTGDDGQLGPGVPTGASGDVDGAGGTSGTRSPGEPSTEPEPSTQTPVEGVDDDDDAGVEPMEDESDFPPGASG